MDRIHEQILLQARHTNGQQTHMEKCLTSLGIREIQIKTTRRYHLTPVTMAKINKTREQQNVGENVEKGEPSYTVGGNASWYSHSGKQYGGSSRC